MNPILTFQRAAKNAIIVSSQRKISNGQMDSFREKDTITTRADLNETTAPDGFQFKKSNDHALCYNRN